MNTQKFSGRWFRLYDSVLDDPKVQRISDALFRLWVDCLCLCSQNSGYLPRTEDVSFRIRKTVRWTAKRLSELQELGLLDEHPEGLAPHNWNNRQFKSDNSTPRVQAFRKRHETVSETVPDTDTDTDTEQSRTEGARATPASPLSIELDPIAELAERMYTRHPKTGDLPLVLPALVSALNGKTDRKVVEDCHFAWCESARWRENGGQFAPKLATWISDRGWQKWPPGRGPKEPPKRYELDHSLPPEAVEAIESARKARELAKEAQK